MRQRRCLDVGPCVLHADRYLLAPKLPDSCFHTSNCSNDTWTERISLDLGLALHSSAQCLRATVRCTWSSETQAAAALRSPLTQRPPTVLGVPASRQEAPSPVLLFPRLPGPPATSLGGLTHCANPSNGHLADAGGGPSSAPDPSSPFQCCSHSWLHVLVDTVASKPQASGISALLKLFLQNTTNIQGTAFSGL